VVAWWNHADWVVDSCPLLLSTTALFRKPKAREDHPIRVRVLQLPALSDISTMVQHYLNSTRLPSRSHGHCSVRSDPEAVSLYKRPVNTPVRTACHVEIMTNSRGVSPDRPAESSPTRFFSWPCLRSTHLNMSSNSEFRKRTPGPCKFRKNLGSGSAACGPLIGLHVFKYLMS
jgi:hypothetical protein